MKAWEYVGIICTMIGGGFIILAFLNETEPEEFLPYNMVTILVISGIIFTFGNAIWMICLAYFKEDPHVRKGKYRIPVIITSLSITFLIIAAEIAVVYNRILGIANIDTADNPLSWFFNFFLWSSIVLLIALIPILLLSAAL